MVDNLIGKKEKEERTVQIRGNGDMEEEMNRKQRQISFGRR
jgi:hypothetical protein